MLLYSCLERKKEFHFLVVMFKKTKKIKVCEDTCSQSTKLSLRLNTVQTWLKATDSKATQISTVLSHFHSLVHLSK